LLNHFIFASNIFFPLIFIPFHVLFLDKNDLLWSALIILKNFSDRIYFLLDVN
jgi:hypothetical protein